MVRKLISVLLMLFCINSVFANDIDLIALFEEYDNDLKPISMAIAGSYLNKPKIELDGVYITKGKGVLPRRIEFNDSDASTYLYALDNPRSNGIFGFFSTFTSALSPLVSKAQDILLQRGFEKDEVIVNGWLEIAGGENLDLMSILIGSDFSSLELNIGGELSISGERNIKVSFNGCVSSDDSNAIKICFNDFRLDDNAVKTGPIMISFVK